MGGWKLNIGQTVAFEKGKVIKTIAKRITNDPGKPYYLFNDGTKVDDTKVLLISERIK